MSMAEMQACLARLYVDRAFRRLFALEPETVLREYRLSAEEAEALRALDGNALERFARSLRSKRSHTVGVMVFDMTDPYCTLILRGIENSLYQSSYLPILTDVHNERGRFERYLEMLLDRRVEALIVLANWLFVDIDVLADLEKSSIPTVMIGRELQTDSVSSVIVDNEIGAYSAIEHLHVLGHRKIAFIRGPKTLADSADNRNTVGT